VPSFVIVFLDAREITPEAPEVVLDGARALASMSSPNQSQTR
jgi:hypothetical protein